MYIQHIFPFVVFHFEKDEKILIEDCLDALREHKEKCGGTILDKAELQEAIEHYERLLVEMSDD